MLRRVGRLSWGAIPAAVGGLLLAAASVAAPPGPAALAASQASAEPRPDAAAPASGAAAVAAVAADSHEEAADQPFDALLPPPAQARAALAASPMVRAADAGLAVAAARQRRLQAGPHEWVARAGLDRRQERGVGSWHEPEVGIERGLRWPDKARADAALGAAAVRGARLARGDAWHEAARSLLTDWFDALRAQAEAAMWQGQLALARQQALADGRRLALGELSVMEFESTQAETARAAAAGLDAAQRAAAAQMALQARWPGLPALPRIEPADASTARATTLPLPAPAQQTPAAWIARMMADHHELALARAQAEVAARQAERAGLERRADPTVGVRLLRERGGEAHVLGAYFSWPIGGDGRRADAELATAEAERLQQQALGVERRVQADVGRVAQAWFDARARWQLLEQAAAHQQRHAALQARSQALGEASSAQVLLARRQAQEALLVATQAQLDALAAHARLLVDAHQRWAAAHDDADGEHDDRHDVVHHPGTADRGADANNATAASGGAATTAPAGPAR